MALVVRPARPDDAAGIARVHVATWRSTYRGLIPDEYLDNLKEETRAAYWKDVITRDVGAPDQPFVMVAEKSGRGVVGFAVGGPERRGDPRFKGELGAIYILEAHQRQGIGTRLVQAVARELLQRGCSTMLVWVLAKNPCRPFYEALGGRRIRSETITIGGATLENWAYGWDDIRGLAAKRDE